MLVSHIFSVCFHLLVGVARHLEDLSIREGIQGCFKYKMRVVDVTLARALDSKGVIEPD